ncbi:MAG: SH3 domain-containing protein [Chloroflexota bacterium]
MKKTMIKQYLTFSSGLLLGCVLVILSTHEVQATWHLDANVDAYSAVNLQATNGPIVRIDRPQVNLRRGPGMRYDVVSRASADEQYEVIGRSANENWVEIRLSDGTNVWVYVGIVEVIGDLNSVSVSTNVSTAQRPAPTQVPDSQADTSTESSPQASTDLTIRIDRPRVNLRSGPGTGYEVVTQAVADEQFPVTGRNAASTWIEITLSDSGSAWVYVGIVELAGDINSIDVATPGQVTSAVDSSTTDSHTSNTTTPETTTTASTEPTPTSAPDSTTAPRASTAGMKGRLLYSVANMDDERWELWEYNFGTGSSTKIGDWWTEVDVSKDGSQIVYFAWPAKAGDDYGTWIMDRNYQNNRQVVPGGAYASFSPGGDRLVLNGGQDIFVINTDGGGLRGLTRGEYPSWSPVNDQVVHRACVGGGCGLWIIDANSTDPSARSRLTTGGSDGQPAWSPNGQRIAYISQEDGNFEIYVINTDGSGKQRLTTNPASDGLPVWSPDGQWIAFRSDRGGSWAIYAMRSDGSDLRKIIDADVLPAWFFEKMDWF